MLNKLWKFIIGPEPVDYPQEEKRERAPSRSQEEETKQKIWEEKIKKKNERILDFPPGTEVVAIHNTETVRAGTKATIKECFYKRGGKSETYYYASKEYLYIRVNEFDGDFCFEDQEYCIGQNDKGWPIHERKFVGLWAKEEDLSESEKKSLEYHKNFKPEFKIKKLEGRAVWAVFFKTNTYNYNNVPHAWEPVCSYFEVPDFSPRVAMGYEKEPPIKFKIYEFESPEEAQEAINILKNRLRNEDIRVFERQYADWYSAADNSF